MSDYRQAGLNMWREIISLELKDKTKHAILNAELRNIINEFFNTRNNEKRLPLLKIINFVENMTYDYLAGNKSLKKNRVFTEVYKYCYKHFRTSFKGVDEKCFENFHKSITDFRNGLPVAGVIIVNKQGEFLCVISERKKHRNQLNFPMGKQDYNDEGDLKTTAIRELGEETGIHLTDTEITNVRNYTTIKLSDTEKPTRFYIVEGFDKDRVNNINRTKRGEIRGLVWVSPLQVRTRGRNEIDISFLNPDSKFVGKLFNVSKFVKTVVTKSNDFENPFETFGCNRSYRRC